MLYLISLGISPAQNQMYLREGLISPFFIARIMP